MVNYTSSDVSVFAVSILGSVLGAVNDYADILVIVGIMTGLFASISVLLVGMKRLGK